MNTNKSAFMVARILDSEAYQSAPIGGKHPQNRFQGSVTFVIVGSKVEFWEAVFADIPDDAAAMLWNHVPAADPDPPVSRWLKFWQIPRVKAGSTS